MKLGFVSMPLSGDLNPITALAGRLQSRGHALESLAQGVPIVANPIGYDQPGVAARIAHHGVGEFVAVGPAARNVA